MGLVSPSSWDRKTNVQSTNAQCGRCGLSKQCYSPKMPPTGKGTRKILFIAEAPGEQEDRQGIQLVGKAGQLLRDFLYDIGIDLDDCWKTNAVLCHPPENKVENKYIEACRPSVIKSIQQLNPNVIVLLGASAVKSVIGPMWAKDLGGINKWAGWTIPSLEYNAWICPTYHPSYILRMDDNPLLNLIFKEHLQQAVSMENKPVQSPYISSVSDLQNEVEIITSEKRAKQALRMILKNEGFLAWDYETTGLKPEREDQEIVSVSFCLDGQITFALPFTNGVRRLVSKILKKETLRKIASNMKFEERWTRAKLGHGVAGWHWDTMLAAHCLDNRSSITSVKFQSFVNFGISDYSSTISPYLKSASPNEKNRIREINMEDLLIYNGMDSLLEYMLAMVQMEKIGTRER